MTNRVRRTRATLRHWRNFLSGVLIGAAVQTPVFAASDLNLIPDEWTARLTHGDPTALAVVGAIVLVLAIAVALGIYARMRASKAPPPDPENSIGRYRPFRE